VLVHESRLAELEQRLMRAYRQVRIGDPIEPGTLMGPLVDGGAVRQFESAVAEAVASGGRLLTGGRALDRPGRPVGQRQDAHEASCAIVILHIGNLLQEQRVVGRVPLAG